MLENGVMLSIQVAMLHDILSSSERIVQREVVHTVWNGCNFRAGREPVDIVPFALIAVKNPRTVRRLDLRFRVIRRSAYFH